MQAAAAPKDPHQGTDTPLHSLPLPVLGARCALRRIRTTAPPPLAFACCAGVEGNKDKGVRSHRDPFFLSPPFLRTCLARQSKLCRLARGGGSGLDSGIQSTVAARDKDPERWCRCVLT